MNPPPKKYHFGFGEIGNRVREFKANQILLDVSPFEQLANCKSNNGPQNKDDYRGHWYISEVAYLRGILTPPNLRQYKVYYLK